jgi:hypothetical protein
MRPLWLVHANAQPVTSDTWLRHLEQRTADSVAIADAHFPVGQAIDRKVLSELPVGESVATELALPMTVGIKLIDADRPVLAAASGKIALPVSIDVEPPHHASSLDRRLPNGRMDSLRPPFDVAWQADVHGNQMCGHFLLASMIVKFQRALHRLACHDQDRCAVPLFAIGS